MANPFYGLPRSDLIELKDLAIGAIKAGKTMIGANVGGKGITFQREMTAQDILLYAMEEIRRVDGSRVTRTKARFI